MRNVLIPIDAGNRARTMAAVAAVVRIYRQEPVGVHLLSVQPAVSGHVAMFFGEGELTQLQLNAGAEDLGPAQALLKTSGVPFTSLVRVGRSAETIARTARELGCDRIVLGPDGEASFAGKIFGSLAQQVRQLVGAGSSDCQVIGS
jgi:nucleotide-binding universal stress UspA family protein